LKLKQSVLHALEPLGRRVILCQKRVELADEGTLALFKPVLCPLQPPVPLQPTREPCTIVLLGEPLDAVDQLPLAALRGPLALLDSPKGLKGTIGDRPNLPPLLPDLALLQIADPVAQAPYGSALVAGSRPADPAATTRVASGGGCALAIPSRSWGAVPRLNRVGKSGQGDGRCEECKSMDRHGSWPSHYVPCATRRTKSRKTSRSSWRPTGSGKLST
jgi:hypothetical protein